MDVETAIADTGFVVALLNQSDQSHPAAVSVYLQQQTILLPQTTLTEVAYLVGATLEPPPRSLSCKVSLPVDFD
jgi:uncharacterized protein